MSRAILAITDEPDQKVGVKVTHVDGWNPDSNAHKLSSQIVKFLDEQCVTKEKIAEEEATPEEKAFHDRVTAPMILIPR